MKSRELDDLMLDDSIRPLFFDLMHKQVILAQRTTSTNDFVLQAKANKEYWDSVNTLSTELSYHVNPTEVKDIINRGVKKYCSGLLDAYSGPRLSEIFGCIEP